MKPNTLHSEFRTQVDALLLRHKPTSTVWAMPATCGIHLSASEYDEIASAGYFISSLEQCKSLPDSEIKRIIAAITDAEARLASELDAQQIEQARELKEKFDEARSEIAETFRNAKDRDDALRAFQDSEGDALLLRHRNERRQYIEQFRLDAALR